MWSEGLHAESSPPLYYMALGAWIQLFGSSEFALRSLSVISSSFAIVLVYILGKELLGYKRGLIAAALFAASATQIFYAQEVRPYALLLIPVLATLIACARYLREPGSPLALFIYVIGATAGIYTHTTMLLFVAVCGITFLAYAWWRDRSPTSPTALRWIAANSCVAAFAIPAFIAMTSPTQFRQLPRIPSLNLLDVGAVVSNTIIGTLTPGHFPGGIAAQRSRVCSP